MDLDVVTNYDRGEALLTRDGDWREASVLLKPLNTVVVIVEEEKEGVVNSVGNGLDDLSLLLFKFLLEIPTQLDKFHINVLEDLGLLLFKFLVKVVA